MKRSNIGYVDYSGGDCNFISGCTAISPGCAHCYARAIYDRFGRNFDEVRVHPDKLARLANTGFPPFDNKRGPYAHALVFVVDMGDLFHPDVPNSFVIDAFDVMRHRTTVDWVILTKRPQIMAETLALPYFRDFRPSNIWMGVTAENQAMADQRIPVLLDTWAGRCFVSVEPMLEAMDLGQYLVGNARSYQHLRWVIAGAESGPHRREFRASWARELWQQCQDNGVSFFAKQNSGLHPGTPLYLDGREVKEWPR